MEMEMEMSENEGDGRATVPTELHGKFIALAQGRGDYIVDVIPIGTPRFGVMMTICATEEAIYISREQAKAFFGLVEPVRE